MILASGLAVSNKPFSNEPDNAIHAVLEMCFTEESKFILKALRSTYIPSIIIYPDTCRAQLFIVAHASTQQQALHKN